MPAPPLRSTARWLLTITAPLLTGALAIMLRPVLHGEITAALIFLLGIVIIGAVAGVIPALVSAMLAALAFNVFISEPRYFLQMAEAGDLVPVAVFLACAIISGTLSGKLHSRTRQLSHINQQLNRLVETNRLLQPAADLDAISEILERQTASRFGIVIDLFVLTNAGLAPVKSSPETERTLSIASRCLDSAGCLSEKSAVACRLDGLQRIVGSLVVTFSEHHEPDIDFVQAFAGVVALAVERTQLSSFMTQTVAEARSNQMKTAILSSVSHDLRTPLTVISAAASGLMEYRDMIDQETSDRLLSTILMECGRLDRFTSNLLEMSRLEGGKEILKHETVSSSELVTACLDEMTRLAPQHHFRHAKIAEEDSVVTDAALFELALLNILQNAVRYSEPGTTVTVAVTVQDHCSVVTVIDEGCGISETDMPHIFKRFYRGTGRRVVTRGTGLGLTIAKAFVEFFDGSITVVSPAPSGSGTSVALALPLAGQNA